MKNAKRITALLLTVLMLMPMMTAWSVSAAGTTASSLSGETSRSTKVLYPGVTSTNVKTSSSSKYDLQSFNIVEFDLSQTDLYVDVTNERDYVSQSKSTLNTVTSFNANNGAGKTAIAAINGDLWTMTSAHSRVEGKGTSYNGYSDAVVTKAMTLPRGYSVYNGEIVCSSQIEQETPYEGDFWSFGVSDGYVPMIGCPELDISITNNSKNVTVAGDGLNRLPANNALVVYSDKGSASTNSLADAYEVVIDVSYDYTVKHGATITGTVTGIYDSSTSTNPTMQANRFILTARGDNHTKLLSSFKTGDTVTLGFSVYERYGRNSEGWQNATAAVGGHMPFVVDGVKWETGTTTNYPSTIVGIKNDGNVVFIVNDGRQSSFSTGLDFNDYWDFADDMDLNTAFILDGGGSANLIEASGSGYSVVNSPSDGSTRSVVNSVILSAGPKRGAQDGFSVKAPSDNIDLTNINFADDDAYLLLTNFAETKLEKTADGVKLKASDVVSGPGVSISYGLPNTTSKNPNSVLSGRSYDKISSAKTYPYLVLDMKLVTASSSAVQFQALYHTAGSRKGVSQTTFIGFNNAYNDKQFHKYVINPASNSAYSGTLNTFNLKYLFPGNGVTVQDGDYVILRSARLAKTLEEANALVNSSAPTSQTVTFDPNGGSCDQTTKYAVHGQTYGVMPVPVRTGYDFDGWYTAASGGEKVTEDTNVTSAASRTLYAHWTESAEVPEVIPSYISFDLNGGTGNNTLVEITKGQTYRSAVGGDIREPVRNGYDFAGWTVNGEPVDLDAIHNSDEGVTFVAQWSARTGFYKVTIDGLAHREGPGTDYEVTGDALAIGSIVSVSEISNGWVNCITTDGRTGWSSLKYLEYVEPVYTLANGQSMLLGFWSRYAVFTIDMNGAWYNHNAGISRTTVINNVPLTATSAGIGLGSGFEGFEVHVYEVNNSVSTKPFNDGYFGMIYRDGKLLSNAYYMLGDLMDVIYNSMVRDSHDIVSLSNDYIGTFDEGDFTSSSVNLNSTYLDGSNYTFTATWEPQTNDLILDPNGGEMPEGYETEYTFYGDQRLIDVIGGFPEPVREGYEFMGWTRANSSDRWTGGWGTQPFTFGTDMTFTADWKEIEIVDEGSAVYDETDGKYYFVKDGERQEKGLYKSGSDYYYVKHDGTLACDETVFTYYHRDVLPAAYRSFGADCRLVNGWVKVAVDTDKGIDRELVYHSVNGEHSKGITKIGEDYYFFNLHNGEMRTAETFFVGENEYGLEPGSYYFGLDGKLDLMNGVEPVPEQTAEAPAAVASSTGLGNYINSAELLATNVQTPVLPEAGETDGDDE